MQDSRTVGQSHDHKELDDAINLLTETHNNLKSARNKKIILFAGSTGSGKSTNINLLLGNTLQEVEIVSKNNTPTTNAANVTNKYAVKASQKAKFANVATGPTTMKALVVK